MKPKQKKWNEVKYGKVFVLVTGPPLMNETKTPKKRCGWTDETS